MRLLYVVLLSAAMAAPVAPAFAVDNSISAYCGTDYAGTGYQRPGGYCDQVASNKSLLDQKRPTPCPVGFVRDEGGGCVCDHSA